MAYSSSRRIIVSVLVVLATANLIFGGEQISPADSCLLKAGLLIKQHKPQEAKAQIDLAIRLEPYRNDIYDSASLLLRDDVPAVEKIYKDGLKRDPDNAGLLNGLGYFYADKGIKLKESLKLTSRAVALQPKNAFIVDSLGWAQFKNGDYTSAIKTLKKAVMREPSSAELRYHLGAVYGKLGRKQEASIELRKAVLLDSSLTEAVTLLNKICK